MAKVQTRRSISMKPEPFGRLKAHSEATGISMSKIVTGWVDLACKAAREAKKADSEAANRTVAELGMVISLGEYAPGEG